MLKMFRQSTEPGPLETLEELGFSLVWFQTNIPLDIMQ